jgi:hypothetical protein
MPNFAPVPFGEWRPDIASLDSQFATEAENVLPGAVSYKPIPSPIAWITVALPAQCVGLFSARKLDGSWRTYAGTRTKLYEYDPATTAWVDISRAVGGAYNVSAVGDLWSFTQFGSHLIAVQIGDVPQTVSIEAAVGTAFTALGGSPPTARTVATVGDFVVLGGLSSNSRMIQWSAINDSTGWTVGTNLSDSQEFPDGGPVMGVSGGELGYVVQDRTIRLMQFLPQDSTVIFSFSRALQQRGGISPYGFTTVGNTLYFNSEDGFYALLGQQVFPIGQDKVNDWFIANSDPARRGFLQCVSAIKPYVFWAYYKSAASQTYDGIILFDWSLQKWSRGSIAVQAWAVVASIGLDLDTTGTETGDNLLDSTARSLDSPAYVGGRPIVSLIDASGLLSGLQGPNLQATLETAEVHPIPGYRAFVSEVEPLCDAVGGQIAVATRETLQESPVWGMPINLESTGWASVYTDARLQRFRYIAPAAATWTHAQGVNISPQQSGAVA